MRRFRKTTSQLKGFGEPGGARTRDHRIKSAMLYQLSYRLVESEGGSTPGKGPLQSD